MDGTGISEQPTYESTAEAVLNFFCLEYAMFLDMQVSLASTHVRCPSVGHSFEFQFSQRLWLLYVKSLRKRTPIIFSIWGLGNYPIKREN